MSKTPNVIRLTVNDNVKKALDKARKSYPTLSDAEILKLGLSKIVTEDSANPNEVEEIRKMAAYSVGSDYLTDPKEDIYNNVGKKVAF
ncbi:MAG: hypothetical protein WD061_02355 [Candidatus Saccharimonadales bacterium]